MQYGESSLADFLLVLNNLTREMVDTNTHLAEMAKHVTYLGVNAERVVDELRTLNSAVGRIEDEISYRP